MIRQEQSRKAQALNSWRRCAGKACTAGCVQSHNLTLEAAASTCEIDCFYRPDKRNLSEIKLARKSLLMNKETKVTWQRQKQKGKGQKGGSGWRGFLDPE